MSELRVGDVVALRVPCLGNTEGTLGVVVDEYVIGDRTGVTVIFENGEYDGFSEIDEQELFLSYVTHSKQHENYQFTNVLKLSEDFRAKEIFKSVFLSLSGENRGKTVL